MSASFATTIDDFVARVPAHSCALAIQGPPGIGKTHHWTGVTDDAAHRGWRLLMARPGEAESRTGSIGLLDLLSEVTDDEIAALPAPQQRALSAAILRGAPPVGPGANAQIVAAALTTLVGSLAADVPVLIAIDDLQWLDATTTVALAFLARRLPAGNVGIVVTVRTPAVDSTFLGELEAEWALRRIDVPPLGEEEIAGLVRAARLPDTGIGPGPSSCGQRRQPVLRS